MIGVVYRELFCFYAAFHEDAVLLIKVRDGVVTMIMRNT